MARFKPELKVGDLVVAECSPNSVQRIVKVEPHKFNSNEFVLHMVSAWRLGCEPNAKTTKKKGLSYNYRLVASDELAKAASRLLDLSWEVKDST